MFELRWITRQTKCKISTNPGAVGAPMIDGHEHKKVLQYRQMVDEYNHIDLPPSRKWTGWADVPDAGLET